MSYYANEYWTNKRNFNNLTNRALKSKVPKFKKKKKKLTDKP